MYRTSREDAGIFRRRTTQIPPESEGTMLGLSVTLEQDFGRRVGGLAW